MDSADRLANALRDTLKEIVFVINQTQPPQSETVAAVVVADAGNLGGDRPERLLYPLEEVRERLGGISRSTLYSLLGSGELVRVKVGSRSFVTAENLQAYVQRLSQTAARNR